jgi:signal peptidase I
VLGRTLRRVAIVAALLVVLFFALAALGVLHTYRASSASMEPTLRCAEPGLGCSGSRDDRIVAVRYFFDSPSRGDIVAFHTPALAVARCGTGGTFVKRVIALGGDRVAERDGRVFVDGRPLAEAYVAARARDRRTIAAQRIPSGRLYLLGDNRSASCDSREWGTVAESAVIGRVVARYWPLRRIGIQ